MMVYRYSLPVPYKKLRKLCFYGFTTLTFFLGFMILFRHTSTPTRTEVAETTETVKDNIMVDGLNDRLKSLKETVEHLRKKEMTITPIKRNDSNLRGNAAVSTIKYSLGKKLTASLSELKSKPFKFFIYDIPASFNTEIIQCIKSSPSYQDCFDLSNNGMGKVLAAEKGYHITNTNQFSLEVLLHHQLKNHPFRTFNISDADVFYVPAYLGLTCFCLNSHKKRNHIISNLYKYLNQQVPFQQSRPHFSTLAKIEREQATNSCPLLRNINSKKLTFVAIERETNTNSRKHLGLTNQKTIVVPYPSYVHYNDSQIQTPNVDERNIFLFFAASVRRTNHFRAALIDQFKIKTTDSYEKFFSAAENNDVKQAMLVTQECLGNHKYTTIPWMRHSVFCLQPPGDSPTRKSFYDSILSGCIPVLFHYDNSYHVRYPFDWQFHYTDFTVILPAIDKITSYPSVFETLSKISSEEIDRLHSNLEQVAKFFQYQVIPTSASSSTIHHENAVTLILEEIRQIYDISNE